MIIAAGSRFPLTIAVPQGAQLWLDPLLVALSIPDVSDVEAEAMSKNSIELYLNEIDGLASLVLHIPRLGWFDSLLAVQSAPNAELQPPPEDPNQGYGISIVLVNQPSSIVKAQRFIGLSNQFSRGLYEIWIRHRNDELLSDQEFRDKAAIILDRFPNSKAMAARAPYSYKQRAR